MDVINHQLNDYLDEQELDEAIELEKEVALDEMVTELLSGDDTSREINDEEYKVYHCDFMDEFLGVWQAELTPILTKLHKGAEMNAQCEYLRRIMTSCAEEYVRSELGL